MSDCDRQKNNKNPIDDRSTITVTTGVMYFKLIGNGLVITTATTTTAIIFFGLRLVGMRQGNALLISTSLV